MQLALVVGEFFSEADRVGPEAEAQFRFFLQEKARRCAACNLGKAVPQEFPMLCWACACFLEVGLSIIV